VNRPVGRRHGLADAGETATGATAGAPAAGRAGDPLAEVIRAADLTKVFASAGMRVVALENADLSVRAGEFVSLIGPSGCGKTTLLRLVADLEQPTSGELLVTGTSAARARLARAYGYVFQSPVLYDWRTVIGNVMLPLEIMGFGREERRGRANELLNMVGLSEFKHRYPWQLSGGMQQRVSIARALAFDPKLLLMDEPFGALDEITREALNLELLRLWGATQKTILFVTHSIAEAVFLSTRIVVMTARPGKIERVIDVDLPQPRGSETREDPRFFELEREVRESLRGTH
jgi:NitT/TauT family transport system ATP-binding protein